jgi:hypothetical protein
MDSHQWVEALDRHAEGLREGTDLREPLLAVAKAEDRGTLAGLLETARRVQVTLAGLAPHEPRPAFVAQLKAQLAATPRPSSPVPDRRTLVWWAAGVGGVISAAGLGYFAYKAIGTGISGIIAQRAARPALPEAQTAP